MNKTLMKDKTLKLIIAKPQGFCAGVDRAISIVNKVIEKYPDKVIYVKHEIVHNKYVVNDFKNKGVIFIDEIDEITHNAEDVILIFSAHGVSQSVEIAAKKYHYHYLDATCPLVKNVHNQAIDWHEQGYKIILIGHKNHPEVIGTIGRVHGNIEVIDTEEQAKLIDLSEDKIACITQTTLSMDDVSDVLDTLKSRKPDIKGLDKHNICYATQNRQSAIKQLVHMADGLLVVGSDTSSNSARLREIGVSHNIDSILIDSENQVEKDWFNGKNAVIISAGASSPKILVENIIEKISSLINVTIEEYVTLEEKAIFHLPRELR